MTDGDAVPSPRPIEIHRSDPRYAGGVWALVPVDIARLSGKVRRINVTVPERALARLDRHARKTGESRSGVLLRAVLEFLAKQPAP